VNALLFALAALSSSPIRVHARPEMPWVAAVVASSSGVSLDGVDANALGSAGAKAELADGLAIVEGPPEADDVILAAARAIASHTNGAIFVEGRTQARSTPGPLPHPTTLAVVAPGAPLAPSPGLFDLEGAALALFIDDVVPNANATLLASPGAARLVADVPASAKDALAAAVAQPLAPKLVDSLRTRANAVVAEHRSRVGGWAKDAALMWLSSGSIEPDDPGADLGARIRARIFPDALAR
jgi:hypothetical protein